MLDRRTFLRRLGFGTVAAAAAATGAIDVERLLWNPGERTIFLPSPPTIEPLYGSLVTGDIFTIEGYYALNPRTYKATSQLQQFVVTADIQGGEVLTIESIFPKLITEGPYQTVTGKSTGRFIDGRTVKPHGCGAWLPPRERRQSRMV